jgi:hypothetical protein
MNELDWIADVSLDQLKAGYVEQAEHYTCLCCGRRFEKGVIYPDDGILYEAGKYTRVHISREHHSVFRHLLSLDKSVTGLTDLQRKLLALFHEGKSDAEVQKALDMGSTSTVRNHRFLLKERERQAKVFLALMEMLRAGDGEGAAGAAPAAGPHRADRSRQPAGGADQVLTRYFPYGTEGPLRSIPRAPEQRLTVLAVVAGRFEMGRPYTEKEVNLVLEPVLTDYVTLRRYLVDYGFLQRTNDGSQYWRSEKQEENRMDRKAELKRLAKEAKTDAGVYQIKNVRSGKVFIESTRNLKTINGQQFQLEMGSHRNKQLQQEWNEFGKEAFVVEVLEILEKEDSPYFDERDALKKLKAKWLTQLRPVGDRGYHSEREIESGEEQ